ncbi:hypothetical protein CWS72_05445 [Telmatospirillum siberiense]|uniref:Uncharacterized protein n=1 Tax=Telmatospirillum siberiense TaxID=382514 RepID=A0A2N3PYT3_9PROT|nr:hypothetical protein CWS72_05445 [Telmatospirillum siberiense]
MQFVIEALRRQGVSLPPERRADVAQTASKLTATSRLLEERLTLANDVHGFLTALRQRATS